MLGRDPGLALAARLGRVRLRGTWNRAYAKATFGRRVRSALSAAGLVAFLVIVVWSPQAGGLVVLGVDGLDATGRAAVEGAVGTALLGYTILTLYGSLLFSISVLVLERDLELLLVSPYPIATVLAAKLWVRIGGLFLVALAVCLPLVVGVPVVTREPLLLPLALVVIAVIPVLPVALMSALVMFLVRYVPARRVRGAVGLLSVMFAVGLRLASTRLNPGSDDRHLLDTLAHSTLASTPWLPHGWAARAVYDALAGQPVPALGWAALLVGTGLLAMAISVLTCARLYVNGWTDYQPATGAAPPAAARAGRTPWMPSFPLRLLTQVDRAAIAVMTKDWRMRRRDLVMQVRMLLPLLALGTLALRGGGALGGFTHIRGGPLAAAIALAPIPLVTLGLATAFGLTALSMEGGAMWIYATAPNSLGRLLQGKVLVAVPPVALAATLAAAYTEFEVHPGLGWALPSVALAAIFGGSLAAVMVAVGGLFPRFTWTDPRRMISRLGAWAGLILQGVMIAVVAGLLAIGIVVGRFHLLPEEVAYGVGIVLAAGACAAMAWGALAAATARLELVEYGAGLAEQSLS